MAHLTMLSSMADQNFQQALRLHVEWDIAWLDLRDAIYGKRLVHLTREEAEQAKEAIEAASLPVHCFSTAIFLEDIDHGEAAMRTQLAQLDAILPLAQLLQPKLIRVLAAGLGAREDGASSVETIADRYPWVIRLYREAVDRITDAGFIPTIENEAKGCFLRDPQEFHDFFDLLDRRQAALTWDVQNHWANGVFPSVDVYETLKPLIRYVHAKGGRGGPSRQLEYNVALDEADWPVLEIIQKVVDDEISPVICLNPPQHGRDLPGYDYASVPKRDLDFLRRAIRGLH